MSLLNKKVATKLESGVYEMTLAGFEEVSVAKDGKIYEYVQLQMLVGENAIPYKFNLFEAQLMRACREMVTTYFPGAYLEAGEVLAGLLGKTIEVGVEYNLGQDGRQYQNLNFAVAGQVGVASASKKEATAPAPAPEVPDIFDLPTN